MPQRMISGKPGQKNPLNWRHQFQLKVGMAGFSAMNCQLKNLA